MVSPTASGKSYIIYLMMRYYLDSNYDHIADKVLLIVPTTSLVKQMVGDFAKYSENDAMFDAEGMCHEIMAGKDKGHETKKIYVSTWQSIYKMQKGYFQQFGMVIGDEAHGFKAKSLTSILTKCSNANYRYGLTGTLDGTQTHKLVLEGLFGPHKNITTSKELIDRGDLANISIDILLLKHKEEHCKEVSKMKYQDEVDWIVTSSRRNNFIKNLAIDLKGNTLVLFQYVEKHGEPLFRLIDDASDDTRKVFYVSGKTPADTREEIRAITETEQNAILVCSYGTFSTGINIVNLHNIIFASPSKSQIRVLQSIGRGLRKSTLDTTIYDIADDLHWKNNKNYTLNHSAERVKIYSKERFKFNIHEVKLL
jgi:superfamily II DNA or RNA helicase